MTVSRSSAREVLVIAPADFARRTAAMIAWSISTSVHLRGRCRLVCAGGRTPAQVYRVLATLPHVPWEFVEVFIGDERCVAPTDAESNYGMIAESLLRTLKIPAQQIHRLRGDAGASVAAAEYNALLGDLPEPKFDLVISGVGADGHTASLFPDDARLATETAWAITATAPPAFAIAERVGLSLRALNSTRYQLVLCVGTEKRAVRTRILAGDADAQRLPAAQLRGHERTFWIVDPD